MDERRTCKRCGAELTAGGGLQGMCPKCLMELGMGPDSEVVVTGSKSTAPAPPDPAELEPLFPQLEILELLGQGGMGVVYKARQKGLDRHAALKILPASAERDPSFAERFTREARALASLSHPGIVSVYDFGQAGEHWYFLMEYVDGVNLRNMLRAHQVEPKQALQIVTQICDALQYAHDEGVVHRDIKPENILIDRKGQVKISDFGLAKILGRGEPSGLTQSDQVMGTPQYMAPEQIEHPLQVDHRADIYSLGVVFYELLTGELPLGRFTPPSGKVEIDVRLDEVVLKTLEKEPSLRYQNAGAVKTDVTQIAASPGGGGAGGAAATASASGGSGRRRWWLWIGVAAAVLLVLSIPAALGFFLLWGGVRATTVRQEAARVEHLQALEQATLAYFADRDVLAWDAAGPRLSDAFRDHFDLDESRVERADDALRAAWKDYRILEDHEAHAFLVGSGSARIRIDPFLEERERLERDLWVSFAGRLEPGAIALLQAKEVERALMPYGRRPATIDIERIDVGFEVTETVPGTSEVSVGAFEELPPHLERYWVRLFVVPPQSAWEALELVLAAVEDLSGDEEWIDLRGLASDYSLGRGDAPDGVLVKLDLAFQAEDALAATALFNRLGAELRARSPSAEIDGGATRAFPWGIHAADFDIRLDLGGMEIALPPEGAPETPHGVMESYIRTVVEDSELGIGSVSITPARRSPSPGIEDRAHKFKPMEKTVSVPLARLVELLGDLEEGDEHSVVTHIRLTPSIKSAPPEAIPGWTFEAEITSRRPFD